MSRFLPWHIWRAIQGLILVGLLFGFVAFLICLEANVKAKGGDDMALAGKVTMEVERLLNLSRGFGWEKQKEELLGRELRVTLSKEVIDEETYSGSGAPEE